MCCKICVRYVFDWFNGDEIILIGIFFVYFVL